MLSWRGFVFWLVLLFALVYATPNYYGEAPAVQVKYHGESFPETVKNDVLTMLEKEHVTPLLFEHQGSTLSLQFANENDQLKAKSILEMELDFNEYTTALHLISNTPEWLQNLGGLPMKLGLDLRGGVHFLIQVDVPDLIRQRLETLVGEIKSDLREKKVSYLDVEKNGDKIVLQFSDVDSRNKALESLQLLYPELAIDNVGNILSVELTDSVIKQLRDDAVLQNTATLRNRINELGVAEAVVQRSGGDKIVVELPGVQDIAKAKKVLGATATVELHAVDVVNDLSAALTGRVPVGSKVYYWKDGKPELLKSKIIVSGSRITGATSGFDENATPQVNITLDAVGGRQFSRFTGDNVGKPMSVLFVEYRNHPRIPGRVIKNERVINVATIQAQLGRRFRITGIDSLAEAQELSLLLRAGSLAAPISIVEERTIGPSLGQENIARGLMSMKIGLALVVLFMLFFYRGLGVVATLALGLNLLLMVALLSLLPGAVLTLPGIAGIVLTLGMAVDANVLIFSRIREEEALGARLKDAFVLGFDKAFATIADANITTFIAAVVLFTVGTGPIKGFAVTLGIGIMTSMFTAIFATRYMLERFWIRNSQENAL